MTTATGHPPRRHADAAQRLRTWRELERDAHDCTRCALHESRTHVAFGDGDPDADLMLIGQAPRRPEDLQGKPFCGAAGNLIDNCLTDAGLARADCYLTDLVKCRPPGDRRPERAEIEQCSAYLRQQIARVRPRVIVALGELATAVLLRRRLPLERVAGYRLDLEGITLIPTYHPTTAIQGAPSAVAAIRRDLLAAKAVLDGRLSTGAEAMADWRAREAATTAE